MGNEGGPAHLRSTRAIFVPHWGVIVHVISTRLGSIALSLSVNVPKFGFAPGPVPPSTHWSGVKLLTTWQVKVKVNDAAGPTA
jgi:hypothetical protein